MILKTKPVNQFPDVDRIEDSIMRYCKDLNSLLARIIRNMYDDVINLEKTDRAANIAALPTAALVNRGKVYLVDGTSGGADKLYISVDTGGEVYAWKEISLT